MNAPGHLAAAYLVAGGTPRVRARLLPVAVGALLPDLIDKPLLWLDFTPYGRTIGHSLLLWGSALLLWLIVQRPMAKSSSSAVLVGAASHLAVDLLDDVVEGFERTGYAFSAWFGWPVTNPDMASVEVPHLLAPMAHAVTTLEVATVAACLWHALALKD